MSPNSYADKAQHIQLLTPTTPLNRNCAVTTSVPAAIEAKVLLAQAEFRELGTPEWLI
jgi:hypothetical protein